jgi:hypothetical protein
LTEHARQAARTRDRQRRWAGAILAAWAPTTRRWSWGFEAFLAGDLDRLRELLAPDAQWAEMHLTDPGGYVLMVAQIDDGGGVEDDGADGLGGDRDPLGAERRP